MRQGQKDAHAERSRYVVQMVNHYTGAVIETLDDVIFDAREDTEAHASQCSGAFEEGMEIAEFRGEEYFDSGGVEFLVVEIEPE